MRAGVDSSLLIPNSTFSRPWKDFVVKIMSSFIYNLNLIEINVKLPLRDIDIRN